MGVVRKIGRGVAFLWNAVGFILAALVIYGGAGAFSIAVAYGVGSLATQTSLPDWGVAVIGILTYFVVFFRVMTGIERHGDRIVS